MLNSKGLQTLDLHGKNCFQARIAINSALRNARGVYRLRIVHGHNNGTVLAQMIREEYTNHPLILRLESVTNGATEFVLKEF